MSIPTSRAYKAIRFSLPAALMTLVILLLLGMALEQGIHIAQEHDEQDLRERVTGKLTEFRAALEGELNATLYLANGLAAYVSTQPHPDESAINALLRAMHRQGRHIRNIGLAPGNRLTYLYPLEGNEKALGLYYPDMPDQWPAIQRAIEKQEPNLAGPLQLRQGNLGLIYRVPLFIQPHGSYWGMVSIVIEAESVYTRIGIAQEVEGIRYAIRGRDGRGADGEVFMGDAALFAGDAVITSVALPGGTWQIAARPVQGWRAADAQGLHILRIAGWIGVLLVGVLLYGMLVSMMRRMQAEQALRKSLDALNEAQHVAGVGSWVLDVQTKQLTWSDEAYRIFGLPVGKPLTLDEFVACIHPDDRTRVVEAWQAALGGAPYDIEHRILAGDEEKWVHERATLRFDAENRPVEGTGTVRDITLERLTKESLRESEQRFKTVADYTYGWEYWRGPRGEMLYISPSCKQITGYAQHEFVLDQHLIERMIVAEDRAMMDNHLQSFTDPAHQEIDFRILRKDGSLRWIKHGCRPVYGDDGLFLGRRISNRDITEQKLAEAAMKEANDRLELALDATRLSIWEWNLAAAKATFDAHWAHLVGLPREPVTLPLDTIIANIHPDDQPEITRYVADLQSGTCQGFQVEFRYRVADGSWKWLGSSTKVAERDAGGAPLRAIGTTLDISERKATEDAMRHMAFFDPLTNLPNRRLVEDRLQQIISRAQRSPLRMHLLYIDLDKFKPINDELGHEAGDWLLQRVAERMLACLRESDTVARIGGDEFVILLPDARTTSDALGVAEKIRLTLAEPYVMENGIVLSISSSIGIVNFPDHADNYRDLLRIGDEAMYRAKNAGRNIVEVFAENAAANREADKDSAFIRLVWKPAYASGDPLLDAEHLELFHQANVLLKAAVERAAYPDRFVAALDTLIAHVTDHFTHEEAILRDLHYPGLAEHIAEHRKLLEGADLLKQESTTAEFSIGKLIDFLALEVVAGHILKSDLAYFNFLRANRKPAELLT